jgi:ADP-ribose pyrophosphatase YjhB (NUDIX family)
MTTLRPWPRLATSAAVFRGDQVLLVQRGPGSVMAGRWSLPGGHVEVGERLAEAAAREVFEETGIVADIVGRVDVLEVIGSRGGDAFHYAIIVHAARWRAGDPVAGSDAADARFVLTSQIAHLNVTDGAAAVIERAAHVIRSSTDAGQPAI